MSKRKSKQQAPSSSRTITKNSSAPSRGDPNAEWTLAEAVGAARARFLDEFRADFARYGESRELPHVVFGTVPYKTVRKSLPAFDGRGYDDDTMMAELNRVGAVAVLFACVRTPTLNLIDDKGVPFQRHGKVLVATLRSSQRMYWLWFALIDPREDGSVRVGPWLEKALVEPSGALN